MGKHLSEEEKKKAVEPYIQYGFKSSAVKAVPGYPEHRTLRKRYKGRLELGHFGRRPYITEKYRYGNAYTV